MSLASRLPEPGDQSENLPQKTALARGYADHSPAALLPKSPVILDAAALNSTANSLRISENTPSIPRKNAAMIRGLRDLQQLQKQTIAVLEAVKSNLEDISQVLRSPEATRGMEKQRNAAALLAKGFPAEATQQAADALELLPANPDAHLLLSLARAADQQYDAALAAARKGLALFDRRQHPLAIEAGLLHAIATLGFGSEAAAHWADIIETLPLPVLMEHIARMAVCYPTDAPDGQLDHVIARRLANAPDAPESAIAPKALFTGHDAAKEHNLPLTHRAILLRVGYAAKNLRSPPDVVRFLAEFVEPLADRGHLRTAEALSKRAIKQLLRFQADAMTIHRALSKLQIAGCHKSANVLAQLLWNWSIEGRRLARMRWILRVSTFIFLAGAAAFAYVQFFAPGVLQFAGGGLDRRYLTIAFSLLGGFAAMVTLMFRGPNVVRPSGPPELSGEELAHLARRATRADIRLSLQVP